MRTTIKLDDELLKEVKGIAARTGRTMNDVIEDAVRESLARRISMRTTERFEMPVFHGDGVMPGVDLSNSAALLEIMEEPDADPGR
jgi:hypothetical protein